MKIEAAVRELQPEYAGRVDFVVIPAEETAQRPDEIEAFGFTEVKHGLVAFNDQGDPVVKLPGHNYGREEIVDAVETVLADGP